MAKKMHIAILCGGQSAEHEISLRSARNVIAAIDTDKYDVSLLTIDPKGKWHLENVTTLLNAPAAALLTAQETNEPLALMLGNKRELFTVVDKRQFLPEIDVVFPVVHGPMGEDGTIQGLLKLANVPFVGSDVLGSAIGMDKDVMKRLLRDAGILVPRFLTYRRAAWASIDYDDVVAELGLPFFIKPANLGSSVGVSKIHNEVEFQAALTTAFAYDHKVILEENIIGREIECSVLGNEQPIASLPGEIILHHEFYSYEAKYLDSNGASFEIPARLSDALIARFQAIAVRAFEVLCAEGMARIDFFLRGEEIFVNEINTIPGFTNISMYPKLWEASGISCSALIERLIQLALERAQANKSLKTIVELPESMHC